MKFKKIAYAVLAGMIALGVNPDTTSAMSTQEISQIKVSKSGNFKYWTKDADAKQKLVAYVKDVTNKSSKNFIPVEDRLAVFDVDGTLICETAPYYAEWMMYLQRALYDKNYTPSQADADYAKMVEDTIRNNGKFPSDSMLKEAQSQESVFAGMTPEEYADYTKKFLDTPVEGLSNLKWGESFYAPMVEIVKYLQANDFTVYFVSGSDREFLRVAACDLFKIKPSQVIGTDAQVLATGQGDTDGLNYLFKKGDKLVRGQFVIKDLNMNKVSAISTEIGKQPVLAFGNSGSDSSMLNYAINDNKYKGLAFMVLCDDLERELGNEAKAAKCKKLADDNGWLSISMKNDWKTIYGDNVKVESGK